MQGSELVDYQDDESFDELAFIGSQQQMLQHPPEDWKHQQQHKPSSNHVHQQNDKARGMAAAAAPPLAHFFYATEDMRISRILRRLQAETTNHLAALETLEKLEIAVRSPSNAAYICRSLEILLENMVQILKQCPLECVQKVSHILGLIGYVGRANFPIYKNFLTKTYQHGKSLQTDLMQALKTTISCDAINLELLNYSERLLEMLIDYLENADKGETFIAISETIVQFSKNYEHAFAEHFTDIVDIVVGWHLEMDQPQSLKLHCAQVLQRWAAYFLNEIDFTYGLLAQFLEDINVWHEDLVGKKGGGRSKAELRIASFIGAFTTIMKSLATPMEFVGITADYEFMENAVGTISKASMEAFRATFVGEEIVNSVNDFLSSLLGHNYPFSDIAPIETLITIQIGHLPTFNAHQTEALLFTVLCLVRHQRTSLSRSMITELLGPHNHSLTALKLRQDELIYKQLLRIYHEILMLKNVPLLQEAYKHIKSDMADAIESLLIVSEGNSEEKFPVAALKLNFYLNALSVLATQTSSIISMYALDPSILELLMHNCKAARTELWIVEPTLHNALLQLLAVHCQKSRNFMTTSRLLNDKPYASQVLEEQSRSSPTSEHFTHILYFFATILDKDDQLSHENLRLLLVWMKQLITECSTAQMEILLQNKHFLRICRHLCKTSFSAPIESADCMAVLLENHQIPSELQISFRDTAIYQLNSTVDNVVRAFSRVLGLLPISVSLAPTNLSDEGAQQLSKMYDLEKWYRATSTHSAPLRVRYFKDLLDYLDLDASASKQDSPPPEASNTSPLIHIFTHCFVEQSEAAIGSSGGKSAKYGSTARRQRLLISLWLQSEAARYCVRNKLRTSVGKPQETFLAIEAIIMKYARLLAAKEAKEGGGGNNGITFDSALEMQHKARILLGFLEFLEKHIHNAAQGTAFALPQIEKPAKTFFRINATTCQEWFKRIRPAVCLIASHCLEPEMAIRYSEENLAKTDQLSSAFLEHTLISLVGALLQRNEADSLSGLYTWVRSRLRKDFIWIQLAAEQASGHLEQAATGYRALLDENHMRINDSIKQFILEQLMHCLYYTGQWEDAQKLLRDQSEGEGGELLANLYSDEHLGAMQRLCYGSEFHGMSIGGGDGNVSDTLLPLMDWTTFSPTSGGGKTASFTLNSFSAHSMLQKFEDICIVRSMMRNADEVDDLSPDMLRAIRAGLRESFSRGCTLDERKISSSNGYIFLNHVIQKVFTPHHGVQTLPDFEIGNLNDSAILMKCLLWTRLLEQQRSVETMGPKSNLYLDVAIDARQNGNYKFCRRMLQSYFARQGYGHSLEEIGNCLLNNDLHINTTSDHGFLKGISELAKCIYSASPAQQCEAINLSAAMCSQLVDQFKSVDGSVSYPTVGAETLLNLADWLAQRSNGNNNNNNVTMTLTNLPQLQQLLQKLPETSVQLTDDELHVNMPEMDKAVGRLINASIMQRNDVGDAWLAYGNWCYRWGKKLVELKNSENQTLAAHITEHTLSERDLKDIQTTFKHDVSEEVLLEVAGVLQRYQLVGKTDVVDDDELESNDNAVVESIEQDLRQLKTLGDVSAEEITGIIGIWRRSHKTVYAYYETAIRAYLKYLSIETTSVKENVEDSSFVTTTLRLLRLVVKHAFALQDVLEEGLNTTPLRPWRVIIPQLFSRLNHHESYVRNSLAQLLCRLAQQEPHAVIFPAVVGSQEEGSTSSSSANSPQGSQNTIALSNCFSSLVANLSQQAPGTVRHVQLLVKELRRVALLWEEHWLHALGRLLTEYSPIFSGLVVETRKYSAQQLEKLRSKHEMLLEYVVADLRKIAKTTEKTAETRYEQNFKQHYQEHIEQTLQALTQKEIIEAGPIGSWQKLKDLYQRFQQRSMHSSVAAASTLKISDLSPILAQMHDTAISMPGIERSSRGNAVYIKSIESTVHVLPTKTRPKKLVFLGSNGRKYTYLFKGLEDLHLDERIMQFLSISNLMMERTRDGQRQAGAQTFRAHYYSVIPLGPQSGLISWVDGVTPLFAIYKKWQQRDALLKQQQNKERPPNGGEQQQPPNSSASSQITALRPSELFYKKLRPLLAAQNIKLKDPRKQWPLGILRRVLDELTEETPSDLLSKELWCHATSAAEWRKTVRNYSISMAVMSVIGYIIGLGDRHLDNVLINLVTGEIVHIDYNVCFEKGKTLRVPEKVPFRLTPNLQNALGVTGVEGSYRLGCEYVLRTLRREKETLLTLLEAFVYDPLVDWTVSDDGVSGGTTRANLAYTAMQSLRLGGASNAANMANVLSRESPLRVSKQYEIAQRRQEWELMQQTIKTRFEDIRIPWADYVNDLQQQLVRISKTAQELGTSLKSIRNMEDERNKLNHQVAMIRELEMLGTAQGSHSLNTITHRFQTYKNDEEALQTLRRSALTAQKDVENLLQAYFGQIVGKNSELKALQMEIFHQEGTIYLSEFECVREYVQQLSEKLYEDANFARKEMDNSLQQETRTAMECIKYLDQYGRIMEFYPRSRLRQRNALFQYADWYKQLANDGTDLEKLKAEVENARSGGSNLDKNVVLEYARVMEKITYELNMDLHKAVMKEASLHQQQIPTVESVITEIKDFASLDSNTCSTLQGAMLLVLTETLIHLEQSERSPPNLFKEINFIENLEFVFEQLQLKPKSLQQLSEQKLLQSLRNVLKAVHAFEEDTIFERIVRLFFIDDNVELQNILLKLCNGDMFFEQPGAETNDDGLKQFQSLLKLLRYHFEMMEMQLHQLKHVIKEIFEIEACSWYNILLERLSIIGNLSEEELISWKLEAISTLFSLARKQVDSFKTSHLDMVYDVRQHAAPFRNYVQMVYGKYLYGVTIALAEAYISSFQINVDFADCNAAARLLCNKLVAAMEHNFELEHLRLEVRQRTQSLEHYASVATAYIWANQTTLDDETVNSFAHIVVKEKLLSAIGGVSQSMKAWKHTIIKIQDELVQHGEIVQQRLRWIMTRRTADSEDIISEVMSRFEDHQAAQTARYNFFLQLAIKLIDQANVLSQFETLMDDSVGGANTRQTAENAFFLLIDDWKQVRMRMAQSNAAITPVEKSIVQLLDPEDKLDACWIANVTGLLDEMIFSVQRNLNNIEEERKTLQDRLFLHANELQNLLDNPLRTDLRYLLRVIIKNAKYPVRVGGSSPNFVGDEVGLTNLSREVLQLLKVFSGKLGDLKKKLCLRDDYNEELLKQLNEKVKDCNSAINQHCKELNNLVQLYLEMNHALVRSNSASPAPAPAPVVSPNAEKKDSEGGVIKTKTPTGTVDKKGEQKRNAYAVSVWKRIRMKLEGRDPDSNRRSSVAEQVDFVINEAVNRDNLAVLYEGWTPWV